MYRNNPMMSAILFIVALGPLLSHRSMVASWASVSPNRPTMNRRRGNHNISRRVAAKKRSVHRERRRGKS